VDKSRQKNMAALEDELELKDRALEATSEGITITDARLPDHPVIYVNPGFERLTGYSADEIVGRNARFLQSGKADQETKRKLREAIHGEQGCCVEILNYRKDGTPFWNRFSITPVRDAAKAVTHYIGVHTDVTRQKLAEDALHRSKEELEAVNRRMKRDLEAAAKLQKSLLPAALPRVKGLNIAWSLEPCDELAGDTLNVVPLDDTHVGLYVVDVSGHGVPASLLSVTLNRWLSPTRDHSVLFRPEPKSEDGFSIASPVQVAEKLNGLFPMDIESHQYFTIFYGILDVETRLFRYVSAGHPAPIYLPSGDKARFLPADGFPVGFLPDAGFEEHAVTLSRGDRLFVYSDGVVEALNAHEEEFSDQRLRRVFYQNRQNPLREAISSVLSAVKEWRGDSSLEDDATILGIEVN